jgi:hypothetical protein
METDTTHGSLIVPNEDDLLAMELASVLTRIQQDLVPNGLGDSGILISQVLHVTSQIAFLRE